MTDACDILQFRQDKSQILNYNNPFFPCLAEESFYSPDMNIVVRDHWHDDMEFMYVMEGHLDCTINGEDIRVNAGTGIFVNSRRIHANRSKKGEYVVFYYTLINPTILCPSSYIQKNFVSPVLGDKSFDYLILQKGDWTEELLDTLIEMSNKEISQDIELEIIEKAFKMLRIMYSHMDTKSAYYTASAQYVDTFKAMLTFIEEHYPEKISLDEIAESGNVGKTLCAKIFKQFSGKTPGDYLIRLRIAESMRLLDEGKLSITEIALSVGFNSASHYTKSFREITGITPNKYKK